MANLLRIAALCCGSEPEALAAGIGDGGAGGLKDVVVDAVIDLLRPMQARRAGFDDGDVRRVLGRGTRIANDVAAATLAEVRSVMGFPEPDRAAATSTLSGG